MSLSIHKQSNQVHIKNSSQRVLKKNLLYLYNIQVVQEMKETDFIMRLSFSNEIGSYSFEDATSKVVIVNTARYCHVIRDFFHQPLQEFEGYRVAFSKMALRDYL